MHIQKINTNSNSFDPPASSFQLTLSNIKVASTLFAIILLLLATKPLLAQSKNPPNRNSWAIAYGQRNIETVLGVDRTMRVASAVYQWHPTPDKDKTLSGYAHRAEIAYHWNKNASGTIINALLGYEYGKMGKYDLFAGVGLGNNSINFNPPDHDKTSGNSWFYHVGGDASIYLDEDFSLFVSYRADFENLPTIRVNGTDQQIRLGGGRYLIGLRFNP